MYTKISISWTNLIKHLWKTVIFLGLYSFLIYLGQPWLNTNELSIPMAVPSVLGTAISLMLGFRTNAAYNRWWEARKVWGAIVNDSRSLIRQANSFFAENADKKERVLKLAKQQIAYCYALKNNLRGENSETELKALLNDEDLNYVNSHSNHHNAILQLEGRHLASIHSAGDIDSFQFTEMDRTLSKLSNAMGMCERLKKTVFPIQYEYFTKISIIIFMLLLPFSLLQDMGIYSVPITMVIIFFFSLINAIARYMQDPFENRKTDTPMNSITRTIEINLLQMAGTKDIPDPVKADKNGILM